MSKVVDVRSGGGEFVILGKALVLPSSTTDGTDLPLDGSLRFNPDTGTVEAYSQGGWSPIGDPGNVTLSSAQTDEMIADAVAGKAPLVHVHQINEVEGLSAILNNKTNIGHVHDIDSIVNLSSTLAALQTSLATKAASAHMHGIADVAGLTESLDARSIVGHQHTYLEVVGLPAKLDINKMQAFNISISGKPTAEMRHTICLPQRIDFPRHFVGSMVRVHNPATSSNYQVVIRKNGSDIGTLSIDQSGVSTFSTAAAVTCVAGDWLEFSFPSVVDNTLSDVGITVLGERK